jgi:hypothetical protein
MLPPPYTPICCAKAETAPSSSANSSQRAADATPSMDFPPGSEFFSGTNLAAAVCAACTARSVVLEVISSGLRRT